MRRGSAPLGTLAYVLKGRTPSYSDDGNVAVVTQGAVQDGQVMTSFFQHTSDRTEDLLLAQMGDTFVNSLGRGTVGRVAFNLVGSVAADSNVFVVRPRIGVDPRWVAYSLLSKFTRQALTTILPVGATNQVALRPRDLERLHIPISHIATQRATADYLDEETFRIDTLIAKKRRMMELLSERKRTYLRLVATGAKQVVDGRDLMKPSGVDWIPQIPHDWMRYPLKHFFSFSKGHDAQRLTKEYVGQNPGQYPVYSGQTENEGLFGFIDTYDFGFVDGALLVSTVGSQGTGTFRLVYGKLSLSQNCAVLVPRQDHPCDLQFMRHQLEVMFDIKRAEIPQHMQESLRISDLMQYWVVCPDLGKQTLLAEDVGAAHKHDEAVADRLSAQTALLAERRQALITAAVTGAVDVPGAAP